MRLLSIISFLMCGLYAESIAHTEFEHRLIRSSAGEVLLAVTLTPEEHWHTYWINPGDAGMPLEIQVTGVEAGDASFPIPKRYELAGLVAYGYEQAATIYIPLKNQTSSPLSVKASWLACNDEKCVPGRQEFTIPDLATVQASPVETALAHIPTSSTEILTKVEQVYEDGQATYTFTSTLDLDGWQVFPYHGNFSELDGAIAITRQADQFTFRCAVLGEAPTSAEFLITDGTMGYRVSL